MSRHEIAVLNCNNIKEEDMKSNLLDMLDGATVFSAESRDGCILVPEDKRSSIPKMLNWTIAQYRAKKDRGRYLHVILDTVKLNAKPDKFLDDIEHLMETLKLESWLNTACDPMNYVYQKYCPRLEVDFDGPDADKIGTPKLIFTSHANVSWTCYDLDASEESTRYNEDFTFPMYYIVEFLARRKARSAGKTIDYMNMYPTVPSEKGLFANVFQTAFDFSQETIKAEDEKFRALNLDWQPDNSVDAVLAKLYNIIKGQK